MGCSPRFHPSLETVKLKQSLVYSQIKPIQFIHSLVFWAKTVPNSSGLAYLFIFSWREAHSSTGRLVTGSERFGAAQKAKLTITRSIFELQAPDFAWKFIWAVEPNDKVQRYKKY